MSPPGHRFCQVHEVTASPAPRAQFLPPEVSAWPAGTSPHAPGSVRVQVSMTTANVSWEPGYDGGFEQTFSVWYGPL